MDLARAPRRRPLTARKKGSGYENAKAHARGVSLWSHGSDICQIHFIVYFSFASFFIYLESKLVNV
jgi:hypothetical protein